MRQVVAIMSAGNANPGDSIVEMGCRFLVDRWFPGAFTYSHHYDQTTAKPIRADVIVVCGTPWVWDQCGRSDKYDRIKSAIQDIESPVKIALGIGSAYLFGRWFSKGDVEAVRSVFGEFDMVTCRDLIARQACVEAGVRRPMLSRCPSVYAAEYLGVKHEPTVDHCHIFQRPRLAFTADYLTREQTNTIEEAQDREVASAGRVVCVTEGDRKAFIERYQRDNVLMLRHPQEIIASIAQCRRVSSVRVHGAAPAAGIGCESIIIPVDSRGLTAITAGAKLHESMCDLYRSWTTRPQPSLVGLADLDEHVALAVNGRV